MVVALLLWQVAEVLQAAGVPSALQVVLHQGPTVSVVTFLCTCDRPHASTSLGSQMPKPLVCRSLLDHETAKLLEDPSNPFLPGGKLLEDLNVNQWVLNLQNWLSCTTQMSCSSWSSKFLYSAFSLDTSDPPLRLNRINSTTHSHPPIALGLPLLPFTPTSQDFLLSEGGFPPA